MRKSTIIILACAAAVFVAGASAYFISISAADNRFNIGNVTTTIEEEFPDPDPVPGRPMPKTVRIRNTGKNDCYVRVQALFSDGDMESICSLDYNTTDWTKEDDGWWYYKKVLKTGETTVPLFTKVTVSGSADEEMIVPFDILIRQESRQARGFDSFQSAWS